jgi:frataxin
MDESQFAAAADRTLRALFQALDEGLPDADVDLREGILTVELEDGRQYVINKHAPNRQIWLSSPVSGAAHFDLDAASGAWRSTRGGADLKQLLAAELASAAGVSLSFD